MAQFRINSVFSNHDEFKEALDLYSKETFTTWVISRSKTIAKRNQEMHAKAKTENVQPLNEVIGLYCATYRCKHSGETRSRGKGIRPNRRKSYKMACPAKMYLAYNGKQRGLVVKVLEEDHNHELSRISCPHPKQFPHQTKLEKFKEAMQVATSIADFASRQGTAQFCKTLDTLHQLLDILKSGDNVVIKSSPKDPVTNKDPHQHPENLGPIQYIEDPNLDDV